MFVLKLLMFEMVKIMLNSKTLVRTHQGIEVVSGAFKEAVFISASRDDRYGSTPGSNAFYTSHMEQRRIFNGNAPG